MKPWLRYAICILLGAVGGCGYAISQVRGDYTAKQISNGPWNANTIQGTEKATALIRAKVALHGIMALPAKEAMYYIAKTDSDGAPLNGKCTYTVRARRAIGRALVECDALLWRGLAREK